jgi:hypothetical protein
MSCFDGLPAFANCSDLPNLMLLQKVDDASIRSFEDFSDGAIDLLSISVKRESMVSNAAIVRLELSIILLAYDCKSREYFSAMGMLSSSALRAISGPCNFSIMLSVTVFESSLGGENCNSDDTPYDLAFKTFTLFWKAIVWQPIPTNTRRKTRRDDMAIVCYEANISPDPIKLSTTDQIKTCSR